jgi:hypothetical protein
MKAWLPISHQICVAIANHATPNNDGTDGQSSTSSFDAKKESLVSA